MIQKYRKKPVVIEAEQFWLSDIHVLQGRWPELRPLDVEQWGVVTPEGPHLGRNGDYLIRGVMGEVYFCKPAIFASTYEPVGDESRG
jgi:hypothetical protein